MEMERIWSSWPETYTFNLKKKGACSIQASLIWMIIADLDQETCQLKNKYVYMLLWQRGLNKGLRELKHFYANN